MLVASVLLAIGVVAIAAAVGWAALRWQRDQRRFRTTAAVTGSIGRPGDDLRALVLEVTDRDGTVRRVTDTFYSNFAASRVGQVIEVDIDPPTDDGEPGRVRVPRQADPRFLLNGLLGAAGVALSLIHI